jgi:hypothetical protein
MPARDARGYFLAAIAAWPTPTTAAKLTRLWVTERARRHRLERLAAASEMS